MPTNPPPPGVFGAITSFVSIGLGVECYIDEEPEQTQPATRRPPYAVLVANWDTEHNFGGPAVDAGDPMLSCFAVGSDAAETLGEQLKALFQDPSTWRTIPIAVGRFIDFSRKTFSMHQETDPDENGNTIYKYDVSFHAEVTLGDSYTLS